MAQIVPFIPMMIAMVGQVVQGVASHNSGDSNASASSAEGKMHMEQAKIEEEQSRRRSAMIMGKTQAVAAAAGLDTTFGSPLDIALDQAQQAELEALNIRYMGKMRKYAANQQAAAYQAQGQGGMFAGLLGAGGSFMKGGGGSMLSGMFGGGGGAAAGSAPGSGGLVSGMGY